MLAAATNFTVGKAQPDTRETVDDSQTVLQGYSNFKISQIRLLTHSKVVGLQFSYKLQDGTQIQGNRAFGIDEFSIKEKSLVLGDDEFITEVFGREGITVEYIGFKTSKGRTIEGGGAGQIGQLFAHSTQAGQHFASFQVKTGGHVHSVSGTSSPIPQGNFSSGEQQQQAPPTSQQQQQGAFQQYVEPQKQEIEEQPTPPQQEQGGGAFQQYVEPQQEQQHQEETAQPQGAFQAYAPPPQQGGGFQPFAPIPEQYTAPPQYQPIYLDGVNTYETAPVREGIVRSTRIGGVNPDTRHWDDYVNWLSNDFLAPEITSITLFADAEFVSGIEITYRSNGITQPPVRHLGSQASNDLRSVTMNLETGEYITDIQGRGGNVVDYLSIRTSSGQQIEIGGTGGSPFENIVTPGQNILGFAGGINGHLHNIYVYLA